MSLFPDFRSPELWDKSLIMCSAQCGKTGGCGFVAGRWGSWGQPIKTGNTMLRTPVRPHPSHWLRKAESSVLLLLLHLLPHPEEMHAIHLASSTQGMNYDQSGHILAMNSHRSWLHVNSASSPSPWWPSLQGCGDARKELYFVLL